MNTIDLKLELRELKYKKLVLEEKIIEISEEISNLMPLIEEKEKEILAHHIDGNMDKILYNEINDFLEKTKEKNPQFHYVFEQCGGFYCERQTLTNISNVIGLTKERTRQIYGKFFEKFPHATTVPAQLIKEKIKKLLYNFEEIDVFFKDVRSMFLDNDSFYLFLEKISDCEKLLYPFIPNHTLPHGCYSNKIFDQYCISKKLPISKDEAIGIIKTKLECDEVSAIFIYFNLVKNKLVKLVKSVDNGIVPFSPSVTAMIAQASLYFPDGASDMTIKEKANEIFDSDFSEKESGEIFQTTKIGYIYAYGDSGARHIIFFNEIYNETMINDILNKSYNYISNNIEKSCRLKELVQTCFDNSIHYYDLRHIIKEYGESNTDRPIYFIGKSTQDIAFLNKVGKK